MLRREQDLALLPQGVGLVGSEGAEARPSEVQLGPAQLLSRLLLSRLAMLLGEQASRRLPICQPGILDCRDGPELCSQMLISGEGPRFALESWILMCRGRGAFGRNDGDRPQSLIVLLTNSHLCW